jgi:intein/homing endonuclease
LDPSRYPSFAIYAPSGLQVQSGVAQSFGNPGSYRVLWSVPVDCELSNDQQAWILQATFLDAKKQQYQLQADFNVVEKQITSQENRDLIRLGIENSPFRINWRGDSVPYSLTVSSFYSDSPDDLTRAPIPVPVVPTGPILEGDSVAYIYDIPANVLKPGMYTMLWNVQETASSPSEMEFQQLRVIPRKLLQMIPQLKFIVGRFQAAFELPNFISDADYVEGLQHGLEFINQWHPISQYGYNEMMTTNGMSSPLSSFWLMASAWWVLHSQHLVEVGLSFNMCLEENTLVATSRGLVKLKHLDEANLLTNMRQDIAKYSFADDKLEYLRKICVEQFLNGFGYTADDIIDAFDIDDSNMNVSSNLTRLGLEFFRESTNPRTWAVTSPFYDELARKIGYVPEQNARKFSTTYTLDTPIGLQDPKYVWNIGKAKTIKIGTYLGYALEGTKDHVVPVMTKDSVIKEQKLYDVEPGTFLMIKRDGYDEEKFWDVDLTKAVEAAEEKATSCKNESNVELANYKLPTKMSVSLARVLGYMTSEGWLNRKNYVFGFCNTDAELIEDFLKHWKRAFGFDLPERESTNYITTAGNYCRYFSMANARVYKYLLAIGFASHQAPSKEIPWCILQAPKKYARHFLQTFFEGDGCYSACQKKGYMTRNVVFSSSSNVLRAHIQQMLLRFGIVSSNSITTDATVRSVTVSGADTDKYAEVIGFWKKGQDHTSGGLFYTQKTGVPAQILTLIRSMNTKRGWVKLKDGTCIRSPLGSLCRDSNHPEWTCWYDRGGKTISLERFKGYFEFNRELIKEYHPEVYTKLLAYYKLCDKYIFVPVTSWESGFEANVYDPSLPGDDHPWSHYFYANGFVTHNSGATTSLDYDRTSGIESAMSRLREEMTQNLTPAKISYNIMLKGFGHLSVRPAQLRSYQNRVFRVETSAGTGSTSQLWSMMAAIGIAP